MNRREHAREAGRCLAVADTLLADAFDLVETCESDFDDRDAANLRTEAGDWKKKAREHDEAARASVTLGDVVEYAHPDWGTVRGRVLFADGTKREDGKVYALCQDLSPNGAREWWPVDRLTRTEGK